MIIAYVGRRGSGKTLSMIRQAYVDYKKGRKIYSNMVGLNFPFEKLTKDALMSFMNEDNKLSNCVILIDEIHMIMDSRLSMSHRNLLLSYLTLQTRKRDVDMYYTTQTWGQVDRRMRQQTDLVVQCNTLKKKVNGVEYVYVRNILVDPYILDEPNNFYFLGNKYFGLYDTNEIIGFE